ncbi:MAG: RNA methyltransferase [Planctomycetes bacterium]|nr:RNA methyltransferase [Planctomycetota bacterium]
MAVQTLSKSRLSKILKLHQKKERRAQGLAIASGMRVVREALSVNGIVEEIIASDEELEHVLEELGTVNSGINITCAKSDVVRKIADTRGDAQVAAVVRAEQICLDSVEPPRRTMVLAGAKDPGNAGTLIRAAWAFGFGVVIFAGDAVDPWNLKVIRSSAGGIFHVGVAVPEIDELDDFLRRGAYEVVVADNSGEEGFPEVSGVSRVLVIGGETGGVKFSPPAGSVVRRVRIPMADGVDSLNAAMAGTILASRM